MVATSGYTIGELVFSMMATYALWVMIVFISASHHILEERKLFKGVYTKIGIMWGAIALVVLGCTTIYLIYMLPLRIGTIIFFDGMLFIAMLHLVWGARHHWHQL